MFPADGRMVTIIHHASIPRRNLGIGLCDDLSGCRYIGTIRTGEPNASFPTIASGKDLVGVVHESHNKTEKTVRFHLVEDSQ